MLKGRIDPITLEVIRSGLVSLSEEIGVAMERAAYSEIFTDGLDYSCATFDGKGQMVAMHAFDPCHLGTMDMAVSWVLEEIGLDNIEPGDVYVNGDPYRGGTHVNDVTLVKPVFENGEIVGIPALRAHIQDMGGPVPGNYNSEATEIFQEGLRIPPIKVYEKGEEVKGIWDLIAANVRDPRAFKGDLRAMIGSLNIGERRVAEYVQKYGVDTWKDACDEIINSSERWMRREIDALPDGSYEYEQSFDEAGSFVQPRIKVKITIQKSKKDMLVADYEGSSKQTDSFVNSTYSITACHTYIGILDCLGIKGALAFNSGSTRPIKVLAPSGTIVNADYPVAIAGGTGDVGYRSTAAVIGALAQAVPPERIKAECHGTSGISACGGINPDTGRSWVNLLYWGGGTGARVSADGLNGMQPIATNNKNHIVEIIERTCPVLFEAYSYVTDTSGPGYNKGGVGTRIA